jgi:hypothetical protein
MRTTISIEDSLLRLAKQASLERDCSLGEVVEDALRVALARRPTSGEEPPVRSLKTFAGSGVQPAVDLSSSSALLEIMDGR